jgi:hypothetical protein
MGKRRPMWNSRKAWALVLGGMIIIGLINLWLGLGSVPDGFDDNWRYADAGVGIDSGIRGIIDYGTGNEPQP